MTLSADLWNRFRAYLNVNPTVGMTVDISRMNFPDSYFTTMAPAIQKAFVDMSALEHGAIANPDERRMVGHYWLRNPALAPDPQIQKDIQSTLDEIKRFAGDIHQGQIRPERRKTFKNLLLIGIGGSALGPQFVTEALTTAGDRLRAWFFDNTDPDGMDKVLSQIGHESGGYPHDRDFQIRGNQGNTKWHAGGQSRLRAYGLAVSPSCGGGH